VIVPRNPRKNRGSQKLYCLLTEHRKGTVNQRLCYSVNRPKRQLARVAYNELGLTQLFLQQLKTRLTLLIQI
jgi:hypothetical protein